MSLIKWQNKKLKHIKRMKNNCDIPDLVQTIKDNKQSTETLN